MTISLEELKRMYEERGAMAPTTTVTEQGDQTTYNPIEYGNGWHAFENTDEATGEKSLGGFSQNVDGKNIFYDPSGNYIATEKAGTSDWDVLGPIITAAASGYLSGIPLGDTGLTAANALGAAKAIENKDVLGLLASGSGALDKAGVDLGGVSAKEALNYANMANSVASGNPASIFKVISSLGGSGADRAVTSLGPGNMDEFSKDLIPNYFLPGGEGYVPSALNQTYGPSEAFDPSQTDWAALYADTSDGSPAGKDLSEYNVQDFGADPNKYWDEYMNTMNQVSNNGGFTSGWQTVGTNRVMVNDDGGATVFDPTTQQTSYLTDTQVTALVKAGVLNTADSGYVAATGGTGTTPGGSGGTGASSGTSTKKAATTATTDGLSNVAQQIQASQDPYAHIKYMEELFGPQVTEKFLADASKSTDIEALIRALRG